MNKSKNLPIEDNISLNNIASFTIPYKITEENVNNIQLAIGNV